MEEWERRFAKLETIDLSYQKNENRLKKALFFKKIDKKDLVLDLFSGRCDTSYGLQRKGYRIISGDLSIKLLKMNHDVKDKMQLNALALPFRHDQFRGVIIQGGLHHLEDLGQMVGCLNEVKRVLEPGGHLFISEPARTALLNLWLFIITRTRLWQLSSYARNWHELYLAEQKTHAGYLEGIDGLIEYVKGNWTVVHHRVGLVTEFFTLRK